jgi:L-fuconolactonase
MADGMDGLRRDFLIEDLHAVALGVGVTGTILVECERTIDETLWLSTIAHGSDLICGVVGWAPLASSTIVSELERIACLPKVKAVRHPIHDEKDDQFVLRDDFNRGIAALKQFNLRYDILIFERHLPQTIQFVDRHPNQIFVLDHIAKPRIRDRVLSPWKKNLTELARRQNVYCKLSGLVTEANWRTWSGEDLRPFVEAALDAFTPKRVMFGSDWPLVTLASSYGRWWDTVHGWIAKLSPTEREWILSRTAQEAYGLGASDSKKA